MKKLHLKSLKLRLIVQMLVILLPFTLLLGYQSWMDLHRAAVVDHAFQLSSKSSEAHDHYRSFVQGAADAVDTGRVARSALAELDKVRRNVDEFAALDPQHDLSQLAASLTTTAGALAADASIGAAVRLREPINFADSQIARIAQQSESGEQAAIADSIAAVRLQNRAVLAVAMFTLAAAAYFVYNMIKRLTEPLARAVQTAQRIARGDLSAAPSQDTRGDLDGLLQSLSAMERALVEYRGQVEQRTRELHVLTARAQELAQEAKAASSAKSQFLAHMSHEIRTPMNGVLGMLELLELSRLDAEQRAALGVVRESGRSLLRIIDDILDFSKIEADRLALNVEPASVSKVVERCCQIFKGIASSKGLLLSRSLDPRISPALLLDPLRVGQILNNFISNAIKFTPAGRVRIDVELVERRAGVERLRFTVQDSGIGISAERQQHLFQPFAQAANDTAQRYGGTGLGLAICRRLAELMGGTVAIQSEPDRGTTMTLDLSLPVSEVALLKQAAIEVQRRELGATLSTRRLAPSREQACEEGTLLLVVDDHPTNRAVLMKQVAALGYAAESAADGIEALALWKSGRFGLVMTDCNMPEMDGHELAREIRALETGHGGAHTPIIACTANALDGEAELCLAAGMDDYLVKPVELTALMRRLNQWLPVPATSPAPLDAIVDGGPSAHGPLDSSVLAELSGNDPAIEREILLDFRRINDADALALRQGVGHGDMVLVTRVSHRIKGACRMIGAKPLAKECERIERASRASDTAGVRAMMLDFHAHLLSLNNHLEAL